MPDPAIRPYATYNRLRGHALRSKGKPYAPAAAPYMLGDRATSQEPWVRSPWADGHALCECGETSGWLGPDAARRRWHTAHKDQIRAAMATTQATESKR